MKKLSLATCMGCLRVIMDQTAEDAAYAMNLNKADFDLVCGNRPWINDDKHRVVRILHTLMTGTIDKLGLPPVQLSAEYVSCVIFSFCRATNYLTAATWIGKHAANSDLANFMGTPEDMEGIEYCTPRQIFAQICELAGDGDCCELTRKFEHKMKKEIVRNEKEGTKKQNT